MSLIHGGHVLPSNVLRDVADGGFHTLLGFPDNGRQRQACTLLVEFQDRRQPVITGGQTVLESINRGRQWGHLHG